MSQITVEVEIDHGRLTPLQPERLPAVGRGVLMIETPEGNALPLDDEPDILPPGIAMARKAGIDKGKLVVPDDFNDPLPEDLRGY